MSHSATRSAVQRHPEGNRTVGASLRHGILALALIAGIPVAAGAASEPTTRVSVRYRSARHAYLNQGRDAGVAIGQQFVVLRQGTAIGKLEVVFVASRSATCTILEEVEPIAQADRVVRPSELAATAATGDSPAGGELLSPITATPSTLVVSPPPRQPDVRSPEAQPMAAPMPTAADSTAAPGAEATSRIVRASRQASTASRSWARSSGTVSIGWDGFRAAQTGGRDHNELTGRFDVRLRQIGGRPYDVRFRMRLRRTERVGSSSFVVPESETRNRMYEISLRHAPTDGRFSFVVGRVGVSPFVSMGYIDGALAQFRVSKSLAVGAFGGTRPTVDGIQFGFQAPRYGAFLRLNSAARSSPHRVDFILAGITERYDTGDRKYVTVETTYSSPRWTLAQRAEIDFNLPTREGADGGSGLSGLSLLTTYRLSTFSRIHVSYNRRRDHRPGALRLDSDLFEDRFRSSIRAGVSLGSPRGLSVKVNGSIRSQHGTSDRTYSGGLGLGYRFGRFRALANLIRYTGPATNGLVLNARLSGRITRAIQLSGTYAGFQSKGKDGATSRNDHRVGGFVWVDLPSGLFLNGGVEVGFGPNLDGTRALAEAGFRF